MTLELVANRVGPVPAKAGIGLKPEHYHGLIADLPALGFLEVHTENYMGRGGPPHRYLERLARDYALSFHGVAASLAGASPLDRDHLKRWAELVKRYQPALVSEHLAWSAFGGFAYHDLLPAPYTEASLAVFCRNVDEMQDVLGRHILIENPSRYVAFQGDELSETEFLCATAHRTGCRLLLDVNNVYVSACNLGEDPLAYLRSIPGELVEEIHLAGHRVHTVAGEQVHIDDHGSSVPDSVWPLYQEVVGRMGPRPTLIEWDTDVPPLATLIAEARSADAILASTPDELYYAACK